MKRTNTTINMKYKYLSDDELHILENELLQFLVVNGIDGSEWQRLNDNEPEKAMELVGLFSDIVWQHSLEKAEYGDIITDKQYLIFRFSEKETAMFGLQSKVPIHASGFTDFVKQLKSNPNQVELIHQTKTYKLSREEEIFAMMNNGLLLCDKANFDFLKNLYNNA